MKLSHPETKFLGMATEEFTERERAMLELERQWFQFAGNKEAVIRDQFDVTTTRYYQEINRIIDLPAAMAADPLTVKRLQRIRADRQLSRSARRA